MKNTGLFRGALCAALLFTCCAVRAQDTGNLDEQFAALKAYDFGQSRLPLTQISEAVNAATGKAAEMQALEQRLLEVLQAEASLEAKRFAARQLSVIGGAASVPALQTLLSADESNDFATKTLVTVTAPEARTALETAAKSLQGRSQLSAIQALGQRSEPAALDTLRELATHADDTIANAAIDAIGSIGSMPAVDALELVRPSARDALYPALRAAYLKAASDLLYDGDSVSAGMIYTELFKPEHPGHIRAAALSGLVATNPDKALETVSAALSDTEAQVAHIAIGQMRGIPGEAATAQFAKMLPQAAPETQVLLLDALAQRGDASARDAVSALLSAENPVVLEASIKATGKLGGAAVVDSLIGLAIEGPGNAPREARLALASLPAEDVNPALMQVAQGEDAQRAAMALRALAERRALDTRGAVMELAKTGAPDRQQEALKALQGLATAEEIPALLGMLENPEESVRREAERTLIAVAQRSGPEAMQPVLQAYEAAQDPAAKSRLLSVIATAGSDSDTLPVLRAALKSDAAELRAAAVRGLGNWKNAEPLEDLRGVAQQADGEEQAEALTQYLKLLRENSGDYASNELLDRYDEAYTLAADAAQKKRILSALGDVNSVDAFTLAAEAAAEPELKADADLTILKLARALSGAYPEEALAQVDPILAGAQDENLKNQALAVQDAIARSKGYLTAWEYAGPFAEDGKRASALFATAFAPEQDAESVQWRVMPMAVKQDKPQVIALDEVLGGSERVVYLRTRVIVEQAQDAVLELGSNDGVKVWINGEQIHGLDVGRPLTEGEDKIKVALNQGENDLMIAVYQQGGEWGAVTRLVNAEGAPLEGLSYELPSAGAGDTLDDWAPLPTGTLSGQQVL